MRERPVIGLDVDGVVANISQTIMSIYNYQSICVGAPPFVKNDTYTVDDIVDYNIENLIGENCFIEVMKIMENKKACMRLPIYKGAQSLFAKLNEIGDVVFVTKPYIKYKDWYTERNFWIKKNFGVDPDRIIYTSKKYLIDADILIDDSISVLQEWLTFTNKLAIKVNRSYNMDLKEDRIICASSFEDVLENVQNIVNKKNISIK